MATVATVKTKLEWFSSWRDHSIGNGRQRITEYADIGLVCLNKGMPRETNVITINGELDENSSWTYTDIDGEHLSALKMMTTSSPKHIRYYGFAASQMTIRGAQYYLCQHSTAAEEENAEHTIDTYTQKFADGNFRKAQTYHIHMVHKQKKDWHQTKG